MSTFEIARDVILLALALFGAGLSVFNYFQAKGRDRRKLLVKLSTAVPTFDDGRIGRPYARVEVTNIGHRAVTVSNLYIEVPNGGRMFPMDDHGLAGIPDTQLPVTLGDGDTAYRHYAYTEIAQALEASDRPGNVTLTPVADDTAGGVHRGEPWETTAADMFTQGRPIRSA